MALPSCGSRASSIIFVYFKESITTNRRNVGGVTLLVRNLCTVLALHISKGRFEIKPFDV